MAVTQKRGGIEVDGLAETINALGKLDKQYKKEAVGIFREVATDVQKRSQAKIGRVGRYPTRQGIIGRSATSTGAGVIWGRIRRSRRCRVREALSTTCVQAAHVRCVQATVIFRYADEHGWLHDPADDPCQVPEDREESL